MNPSSALPTAAPIAAAPSAPRPFGRNDQLQYGVILLLATATLALSRYLRPAERGFGTHQQLGLPPCTFLQLTGIPCPSCGLTTSFAHAAHGHWWQALLTQPFGVLAFSLTVVSLPLTAYLLYRRITWERLFYTRAANRILAALLVLYLLSWGYKIYVMT